MHSDTDHGLAGAPARRLTAVLLLLALTLALCSVAASGQEQHSWANDPNASSSNVGPSGRWRGARAE